MKYIPKSDDGWIEGRGYKKRILLTDSDLHCAGTLVRLVTIEPHTEVPPHHH